MTALYLLTENAFRVRMEYYGAEQGTQNRGREILPWGQEAWNNSIENRLPLMQTQAACSNWSGQKKAVYFYAPLFFYKKTSSLEVRESWASGVNFTTAEVIVDLEDPIIPGISRIPLMTSSNIFYEEKCFLNVPWWKTTNIWSDFDSWPLLPFHLRGDFMPSQFMFLFEGNMFHKKNVSEEYQ